VIGEDIITKFVDVKNAENINHLKRCKRRKQMSDYINTLTVILEEPIKDEYCKELINAIEMIKGVKKVKIGNVDNIENHIANDKAIDKYFKAIVKVLQGENK